MSECQERSIRHSNLTANFGDQCVPWACFEAERDALIQQKAPATGSWPKKTAKKLRAWLAKRLGGSAAPATRKRRGSAAESPAKRQK